MPAYVRTTIAGRRFRLSRSDVEKSALSDLPEPIRDHFVVVAGRRYPPKQVICLATGLDRADFTTHQARRVLQKLGFVASRRTERPPDPIPGSDGPYGGRQANALRPHIGRWVVLRGPFDVLFAAASPQEALAWAQRFDVRDAEIFRVPGGPAEMDVVDAPPAQDS